VLVATVETMAMAVVPVVAVVVEVEVKVLGAQKVISVQSPCEGDHRLRLGRRLRLRRLRPLSCRVRRRSRLIRRFLFCFRRLGFTVGTHLAVVCD
jgi:hypothetical protein